MCTTQNSILLNTYSCKCEVSWNFTEKNSNWLCWVSILCCQDFLEYTNKQTFTTHQNNGINYYIVNRPGVGGAVPQSTSWLIKWICVPFPPYHKQEELGRWTFEWMFTPQNMSHVTCHVSHVTCHMSHVMCQMSHKKKLDNVVKLIGRGSVVNGAYPI